MKIQKICKPLNATLSNIAADKSISHRFSIFSLLSSGENRAKNYLLAEDTLHTLQLVEKLGASVKRIGNEISIVAPKKIESVNSVLECGNSGTTMRLMIGFLSGISGFFVLSGDKYLNNRPMKRISEPLKQIGAKIYGRDEANLAPLCIEGSKLEGFEYTSEISSAQVKTAMILAGFNAKTPSRFKELSLSRNHSENMLEAMNAPLIRSEDGLSLEIFPLTKPLKNLDITIPNDPSSVFYFVLSALLVPDSKICIRNVLLNPTRIQAYTVLQNMGANIELTILENHFETVGEICASFSHLRAVQVSENISWLIDEAPALAIAFACAKGESVLRNAKELRVKESDRIKAVVLNLQKCGIEAKELDDGFCVKGGIPKFAKIESFGDHRIAMSFAVLGLVCGMEIDESECIKTSFPKFKELLSDLGVEIAY
ncbi:3-phosphoshikimate 1-carboxyvinyltransferase [Campylobacter sp. MIT 21-1685]|uniref:3-phosphoshikimate 1-carboxyvinyltransferase n=1 Tax=unclassified Campylobacter TaxID=2593542 RepID=UPI00224B8478|nr:MULTISPECIES: 3-phosphoshikimate 1-carboxyvinyltransferase [unclassified Campylobacter]MCX2682980.1 3-phosphoshikimate 1-carboxyvinyltransferase [Campylobacter sp. MIT 21-1684]MCX2751262.1 3-phosphoshikimate 1-carboxyvinyltransferase [Campylobacter sp. MIT 21-1682]MCX2807461.1 3-phosphoshikimate 1-carboxyvinyltransferase [Campylobacter sp. MIT 21-1685]